MTISYLTNTASNNNADDSITESIFQCALIDDDGREIFITEQMIQNACQALEAEALSFYQHKTQSR
ncbi:PA1571 family protein [Oceanicoccus sp. KOV_DT_Chl]|uniref:PA1571 family protein n=1 Tax=Oceanicoccus sp. KOV_DT_Chl TaxID=1904639 RepID=UPI000C7CB984|nr:PA1571 family protein [Oceanicoccus sp. KOV_DT_Chl]